ncbi:hypothetical protein CEUSTIGMA_g11811.t1 [Chlamydomonas eustigma]|uniref:Glycosyltransferase family 92 protein n=1 Tax=Chlamydomonas eustigma TaxID=1157962 RepID=A0A250XN65_9CHLO|nr:hypothetical protein CEUSTIGMA_g11811.t1 [Chlamydomonas eustigma]|eukprot:GAX84389.1 hypothetical protein CEUSTIGMA_g11811.t1 [Chlamydomonas eustigma]
MNVIFVGSALFVRTFLVFISFGEALSPNRGEQIKNCLNENFDFKRTNWNDTIERDAPSNLKVETTWSSSHVSRYDLTIVTQLSFDRMPALYNQCSTYPGPMAAAVYLPLLQLDDQLHILNGESGDLNPENKERVRKEVERVGRIFQEIDNRNDMCQLDLMFLWEAFDSKQASLLYPVNSLRNYARMQVRTNLLSAIDVDMMISSSVGRAFEHPATLKELTSAVEDRQAVVLPAFEPQRQGPYGRMVADESCKASKENLAIKFKQKSVLQFKLKVFPRGHTPTNYTKWFQCTHPYKVRYQRMYEPWYIGNVKTAPFHDVKFRGYGLNKIAHVASLNYFNFTFLVHPDFWIIHRPHEDTAVRKVVAREASDVNKFGVKLPKNALYYKVTQLFGDAKRGMIRGNFNITLDTSMVRCYNTLTWLPPIPSSQGFPVDPLIFI